MTVSVTVKTTVNYRPWEIPKTVVVEDNKTVARQDGFEVNRQFPTLRESPQEVVDALVARWLDDVYSSAEKRNPYVKQNYR